MKKLPGDIIILHMCNKNYDQMMYGSWDMDAIVREGQKDWRTDGRKKWHIKVGVPPKTINSICITIPIYLNDFQHSAAFPDKNWNLDMKWGWIIVKDN